jgi:PAS domain S-box-containing protein
MEKTPMRILLVEDNPADARLLQVLLAEKSSFPSRWTHVQRLSQAIEHLAQDQAEIVLLDLSLPDAQGLDTLTALQPHASHLPIIVITGMNDEEMALNAMHAGAQDYLVKGQIDGELLARTLRYSIERRQADEYIRYQSNLLQNVSDAIIGADRDFQITSWNPAAEQIYGWQAEEVLGKLVDAFLQTKYEHVEQEDILREFMEQGSWSGEAIQQRKDGTRLTVLSSVSQVRDSHGKVIGVVAINRDITERKQAEDRIRRQVQSLSGLRAIDMAISSTFDRNVSLTVLLNEAVTQLGVDAAAILLLDPTTLTLEYAAGQGFTFSEIRNSRLRLGEGLAGRAALERRKVYIPDLAHIGSEFLRREALADERFRSYLALPLVAKGDVKGVLEIFHRSHLEANSEWLDFLETLAGQAGIAIENAQLFEDLHRSNLDLERRVAERTAELNRTNAELERANRTKDEFLANMSHELRTPLTSILGLSESLLEQRHGSLTEYQERSLKIVESSGHHLLELINDILDLSKIEAGRFDFYPQPVVVEDFCRSCLTFIRAPAMKKSITVTYTNDAAVARILADPRRLKQVLINLLMNAVKFTPEQGNVTLQVTSDPEEDLIRFSVIDTGIGIAPEDLQRLFQPFMQVDSRLNRQYEGTGLGLALVQRLTDLHGGSVTVDSEVGKGSRFTIKLACKGAEIARLDAAESYAPLPVRGQAANPETAIDPSTPPRVILLAEDNMANILTIGEYLKSYGYHLVTAHDGLEAIQKAVQLNPDVILMDIQMPVMDGLEAIARLRGNPRFANTPIIALTALAMSGDRERCLLAGASEYMSKPVSLKALQETIETLLGRS